MLIRNGKLVDLEKDKDFLMFRKNELHRLPNPVVFRYPRPTRINKTGLKEEPPVFNIIMEARVQTANGLEQWAFTDVLKRAGDSAQGDYIPNKKSVVIFGGERIVTHKEADLIYFLMKKSTQLGSSFVVDDKVQQAQARVEKRSQKVDFESIMFGSTSPLNDEKLLRDIASAWGVSMALSKPTAFLKEELEKKILQGEELKKSDRTAWGISEFIEKINAPVEMKRLAIAQKMIDNKVITYNVMSFYYELTDGGEKLLLVPADKLNTKEKFFVNEAVKNDELWQIVKRAIITPDMIKEWGKPDEYMWLVNEENIPSTAKKEDKIAQLIEIYS